MVGRIIALLLFSALSAGAATRYMSPGGSDTAPYDTWAKAATTPLNALTGSSDGDVILITNGIYPRITGSALVKTNLTWQSVNGPAVTIINAGGGDYAMWLSAGTLIGLTVCGVTGNWGGVLVSGNVTLTNCVLRNNKTTGFGPGGGIHVDSGSATLYNCRISDNSSGDNGGGGICISATASAALYDCIVSGNVALVLYGGGASVLSGGKLNATRTTFTHNRGSRGSAVYAAASYGASLTNCIITYNDAGADQCSVYKCELTGCDIGGNRAQYQPGANSCLIQSCTIIRNYAYGANESPNYAVSGANNILWGNYPYDLQTGDGPYSNTCYGTKVGSPTLGANCITNYPIFTTDWSAAGTAANTGTNWTYAVPTLASNSPCVNVGTNQPWMVGALDLAGNARIYDSIVDMGAYEWLLVADTVSEDYSARALMLWRSMQ